uniref:L10-interacting MYB domain-containing protein-like n=1 Tax=Erigeron canadensis TaxID=72917 RepID=UPI001CB9A5F8|nr:L10-interacting MYB domain-containing protein-like [Erigeron canadensis]
MSGHNGISGDTMEWTEDCVKFFLDLLAEKVKKDPNSTPTLKMTNWKELDDKILVKFALSYGPEKLKAKYHRLKAIHTKFTELINRTGVTWDSQTGHVFAPDDVWKVFIQQNKAFASINKKGCKIYPLLSMVFSKSTASGTFHNASTTAPLTSPQEHRLEEEYLADVEVGDSEGGSSSSKKHKMDLDMDFGGQPGRRRAGRNSEKDRMDSFMDLWSESVAARKEKNLAKAAKYRANPNEATSSMREESTIDDCMNALNAIPSVSRSSYNKALDYFYDVTWRRMFMLMPDDRKKDWLDDLDN